VLGAAAFAPLPLPPPELMEASGGTDPSSWPKRRVALVLAVDGSRHRGLAASRDPMQRSVQLGGADARGQAGRVPVERALGAALHSCAVIPITHADDLVGLAGLNRSSRLDAGVHAREGCVVTLRCRVPDGVFEDPAAAGVPLVEALNAALGGSSGSVRCLMARRVPRRWSARRGCSGRTYVYTVPSWVMLEGVVAAPMTAPSPDDTAAVDAAVRRAAAALDALVGRHAWRAGVGKARGKEEGMSAVLFSSPLPTCPPIPCLQAQLHQNVSGGQSGENTREETRRPRGADNGRADSRW